MQSPLALFMCMTCCDLVVKLNNFLKINKKTLLILSIFLTAIFSLTVLYKRVSETTIEEEILSIDPKFDIVNPSFTINNENEKISVSANKGNFLNNDFY